MPIYEYECKTCATRFERVQPVTAEPVKVCPSCGAETVKRVFHPVGVIFKGSGWYITDSRKPAAGTPGETAGGSTKPESKPADAKSGSEGSSGSEAAPPAD